MAGIKAEAAQRWTVSNMSTSIIAARAGYGYGYAWFPEYKIRDELEARTLQALPLRDGSERFVQLYLVYADRDAAGSGTLRLGDIIREATSSACARANAADEGHADHAVG